MHNRNLAQLFTHAHLLAARGRACGDVSRPACVAQGAQAFLKSAPQRGKVESLQGFQISVHRCFSPAAKKNAFSPGIHFAVTATSAISLAKSISLPMSEMFI